jgi:hypothetical protein
LRHSSSSACKRAVSGSISLPLPGSFSPFPHGTCSLSVIDKYLALEDGPPRFPPGFTCPAVLENNTRVLSTFDYGAVTLYGRPFQTVCLAYGRLVGYLAFPMTVSQPPTSNAARLTLVRFRLFPVRSPLLGESRLISFPPATEMFQFTGFPTLRSAE